MVVKTTIFGVCMSRRIAFIGHRYIEWDVVKSKLTHAISNEIANGCDSFVMGAKGEFDRLALGICKDLRKSNGDIDIEVVITSMNEIKPRYDNVYGGMVYPLKDVKTVMYDIENVHFKRRITESNKLMIDSADTLICYVNENMNRSGAKLGFDYAKRKGLRIINLYDEKDSVFFGMTEELIREYFEKPFK